MSQDIGYMCKKGLQADRNIEKTYVPEEHRFAKNGPQAYESITQSLPILS